MRRQIIISIISGILFVLPLYAMAQPSRLKTFQAGEAALADDVNQNFTVVAGSDTGRIFIAPKAISSDLGPNDRAVLMAVGLNNTFTAAFGRPSDYVPGVAPDIDITPLFSGCDSTNFRIEIISDFLNIGASGNSEPAQQQEFAGTVVNTTLVVIDSPFSRTGLGDVNYVTVNRVAALGAECPGAVSLHGILIEYPR